MFLYSSVVSVSVPALASLSDGPLPGSVRWSIFSKLILVMVFITATESEPKGWLVKDEAGRAVNEESGSVSGPFVQSLPFLVDFGLHS